ncbi:hypothetical protein NPIL_598181 [Nephila pilipes]|uniref:Uncharacterized protein n=1 Tax=Nephila pilipes TaxID=299642 RepID=A0A8X6P6U4_NEPPI|nr:hypothetical protein NPIL_598181 [Nephila pilipes]
MTRAEVREEGLLEQAFGKTEAREAICLCRVIEGSRGRGLEFDLVGQGNSSGGGRKDKDYWRILSKLNLIEILRWWKQRIGLKGDLGEKAKELIEKLKEKAKDYWNKLLEKLKPEKRDVDEAFYAE